MRALLQAEGKRASGLNVLIHPPFQPACRARSVSSTSAQLIGRSVPTMQLDPLPKLTAPSGIGQHPCSSRVAIQSRSFSRVAAPIASPKAPSLSGGGKTIEPLHQSMRCGRRRPTLHICRAILPLPQDRVSGSIQLVGELICLCCGRSVALCRVPTEQRGVIVVTPRLAMPIHLVPPSSSYEPASLILARRNGPSPPSQTAYPR
jgi:hypothetical protein